MTKRPTLNAAALQRAAVPPADPVQTAIAAKPAEAQPKAKAAAAQPSRAQRVQIQGYFPEETRRRLKTLAAREGRTVEALLSEAIDDLLQKLKG